VAAAQTAVNGSFAKHVLTVTCRSCTKQESFTGDTKLDAIVNARLAGWVYYEIDNAGAGDLPRLSVKLWL
jgi:hypothetical protein